MFSVLLQVAVYIFLFLLFLAKNWNDATFIKYFKYTPYPLDGSIPPS